MAVGNLATLQAVGKGAYGTVCSAWDKSTNEKVAIKKIANCFDHVVDARYGANSTGQTNKGGQPVCSASLTEILGVGERLGSACC